MASMLFSGAINTLTKKYQFQTCAPSLDGKTDPDCRSQGKEGEEVFRKPWFQNYIMFMGEASILFYFLHRRRKRPFAQVAPLRSRRSLIFALPALCDVLGTGLGGIGMVYVSAPIWQMMRGSIIVFTSLFSKFFLKRQLKTYNWVAIGVSVCGLALVGLSAILDSSPEHEEKQKKYGTSGVAFGIFFVVFSQAFAAGQMVLEELLLKERNFPAPQIVGTEGVFGIIYMIVLLILMTLIPGSDNGSYENSLDSLYKVAHSFELDCFVIVYSISIAFYNFLGVTITSHFSAVHRTLIDSLRTVVVWFVDLFTFYAISKNFGDRWRPHTYLELVGFIILFVGSLLYNAVIKIPGLEYPAIQAHEIETSIVDIDEHLISNSEWEEADDSRHSRELEIRIAHGTHDLLEESETEPL